MTQGGRKSINLGFVDPVRVDQKEATGQLRRGFTVLDGITRLRNLQSLLGHVASLIDEAVGVARADGRTWEEIGDALGISKQAAWERFGRRHS